MSAEMKSAPKRLTVNQVPKYLMAKYNLAVTRQTIYNWIRVGLRKETLRFVILQGKITDRHPQVRVTTEEWVDDFLHRCGVQQQPAGRADDGSQVSSPAAGG